jgi:hypothetical protein
MALENPYCSVAQVQEQIRNTDASLNSAIETAINRASRYIDDYKGRDYFLHDHTTDPVVCRLGEGIFCRHFLYLPFSPVISGLAVKVNGVLWAEDVDYVRVGTFKLVSINGPWPVTCAQDKVELSGKFGYDQATSADIPTKLPGNINQAAILVAAAFSAHNQKDSVGLDGSKVSITDNSIPRAVSDLLGARRLVV